MEKILIKENVISQNAAIADTKSFCKNVNRILPEFKEETGYSLNIDELRIIFFDKNNLSVLIEKVNDATVNNFSAIELPPILKRTLLSDCAKTVNKFAMRLQILSNQSGANHLQNYLTLKNEELTLSSDDEQKIRDEFRIFVTSEEAKEFYEKHREISQRLSEFATYVSDKTGRSFGIDGLAKYYFVNGTNPCEILPFPTDYEKAIQKEWQKVPSWKK